MLLRRLLPVLLVLNVAGAAEVPRERPAAWAAPISDTTLENCYRVSPELYRCEQPGKKDIPALDALGIHSLLNLREYHTDSKRFEQAGFKLLLQRMEADEITVADLVAALRQFRTAPKPVMVHCWRPSTPPPCASACWSDQGRGLPQRGTEISDG